MEKLQDASTQKAAPGDPEPSAPLSFEDLVDRHQSMLWWFARSLGASGAEAEDLVQETFLAAWRAEFQQRSDAESAGYLRLSLARIAARRASKRGETSIDPLVADATWQRWQGDGPYGEHSLRGDAMAAMQDCLRLVGSREREALRMQYAEGMSVKEIAAALDLKPEGAHSLLRRTRAALRECINGKLEEE